ncbi:lanthionine synthetase-like protein [Nocardiopsis sp. Huas11]|uniref:class III lanthionine synthetase LanKC n=1 Tax=Nocardiopsis sp. Huas11 TaxID=2183912 RepID=UPI000EB20261|nr:class III lanthionine synthetase LanKC [Nocardiopsis sp. Huas11]RKS06858.1 lanthionine synthetase-like protein [Nocardiopsis sp. Huas11]
MIELIEMYTLADRSFYETPVRIPDDSPRSLCPPARFTVTDREAPPGWRTRVEGLWNVVFPEEPNLPEQGWKIHVSTTLDEADRTCADVWDYCVANGLPFKYLLNKNIAVVVNTKYAARGSSGKLVTVYPRDEAELHKTLLGLSERIGGRPGPYVLSDLRWEQGPLYVRYGAFRLMTCLDADGEKVPALRRPDGVLVPDRRAPVFTPPGWVTLPDFLAPHLAARSGSGENEERQPYVVEEALHFSNAGGVYRARSERTGAQVVLKEGRPNAGVDFDFHDAIARLRREEANLRALEGVEGVPRLVDSFVLGGHFFLVEEFVQGRPLNAWCALHHPGVRTDASPEELSAFTERALAVFDRLERVLAAIHERGLVFGDLHPNNVMVDDDGNVTLIDFEVAFDRSQEDHRAPMNAPGFAKRGLTGRAVDRYGLAATKLNTLLPFARIAALDQGKIPELMRVVREYFPVRPDWADALERDLLAGEDVPAGQDARVEPEEIGLGILASATPERTDRLFPGDVRQFVSGGYGMAHGAAGVLWALDAAGLERRPEHEEWLLEAVRDLKSPRIGFYDGVSGAAYALDHLGHTRAATDLLERYSEEPVGGISLYAGMAGVCANLAHFSERLSDRSLLDRALELAQRLESQVRSVSDSGDHGPAGSRAGLMRGWSGVALALVRLHRATGDTALLDTAVRALHLDLDQCETSPEGTLLVRSSGSRGLPNIDGGAMGVALAADELLRYRHDDRCAETVPLLLDSCRALFHVQADLFYGKAGQVATLARVGGRSELLEDRVRELEWYALPFRGHTAFHGGRLPRFSMELASGTAGVLLALSAARGDGDAFLPFFSE